MLYRIPILFSLLILFQGCQPNLLKTDPYYLTLTDRQEQNAYRKSLAFLKKIEESDSPVRFHPRTKIDSVLVDRNRHQVKLFLSPLAAWIPYREENVKALYRDYHKALGFSFRDYSPSLLSEGQLIENLIPNIYRTTIPVDSTRLSRLDERPLPVVRPLSTEGQPGLGLTDRNIALWHSHGWYYEQKLKRWEWQRARVFQTVEDLLPAGFVLPYLVPMLENAGALVFMPRERDLQIHEVIVDNPGPIPGTWSNFDGPGFRPAEAEISGGRNLFLEGTALQTAAASMATRYLQWTPDIPQNGEYSVSITYPQADSAVNDARFLIRHAGGESEFLVNQQIGHGTWIYLGQFYFKKGLHPDSGSVILNNRSSSTGYVLADAVRFGGGMGSISREGQISGRPRYQEGARYYLQYAGFPDSLVYNLNRDQSDYKDDYQSRGQWVNYLHGSSKTTAKPGLGIPVDLSLAFHTDAGTTGNDKVIGTLLIYNTVGSDSGGKFPGGQSRWASRDFADILQSELVDDLRRKYDSDWVRRDLWNKGYSEVFRPDVPAALLELLSHHNFQDMKFALDPRFRFDTARAIYKAMLRFLAGQNNQPYQIQPLPVSHLRAVFSTADKIRLSWQAVNDPLEPEAVAEDFIIRTRLNENGFDSGFSTADTSLEINIRSGVHYSFMVQARNRGGKSFPSEIVTVYRHPQEKGQVLIVNGFDRICAPQWIDEDDFKGFGNFQDAGVPYLREFGYTGRQYDFRNGSAWLDDDAPGHGASYANSENHIIPGNTFDFILRHGLPVAAAGYSYASVSDESFERNPVRPEDYEVIDLILGEERTTPWPGDSNQPEQFETFPPALRGSLSGFLREGGALFASGSYIGTDLYTSARSDSQSIRFAEDTLHFKFRTNLASFGGKVIPDFAQRDIWPELEFNTVYNPEIYAAEAPDGIEPLGQGNYTLYRYGENNISAGVFISQPFREILLGFPFETIVSRAQRDALMKVVLDELSKNKYHPQIDF